LIDAFQQLKNNNVHLLLVGNGELENEIKQRIQNQQNQDKNRIHLLPFVNQSEMPSLYFSSDVFILPSSGPNETWGLSVNEAMAAGKAVIVSDKCGCHLDLIVDGLNGYVFKSNDLSSLVDAMEKILDKSKFISMGDESKNIISKWNFNRIAEIIETSITNYNKK
jgi:glycosyltransferase involved in cell wall biosynthesis